MVYAPIEPHRRGMLPMRDGAEIYWEESGNPTGVPALYLHGGPGGGLRHGGYRRTFDPGRFRIIGLDQRGCGLSRPLACESLATLDANTTQALIDDLEALRRHLDVDRWLLHGGSWGSTLALAYALEHPDRVSAIVLVAVTTGRREEIDWITEEVRAVFPEAWARFRAAAPGTGRLVEEYAQLLRDPDPVVRMAAANAWDDWESTHVSLDPNWMGGPMHADPTDRLNFATLVTHYWAHDCFLTGDRRSLDRIGEIAHIPAALIHGRFDISSPVITPWLLHQSWPTSELVIVEDEGHGGPKSADLAASALSRLAGDGS